MKISKRSYWYKVYNFNTDKLFTEWLNYSSTESLCHFMRVVFFWVPFKICLFITIPLFLCFVLFLALLDLYFYFNQLYWSIISIIMFAVFFGYLMTNKDKKNIFISPIFNNRPKFESFAPIKEWITAKKAKVCPFIDFVN